MRKPGVSAPNPSAAIVLVGAGLSGLAAGLTLSGSGRDVVVLEARDRVGGRVLTVRLGNGEPAELGAEWVMEGDQRVLGLAERLGLDLADAGVDYLRREPRGRDAPTLDDVDAFLAAARTGLAGDQNDPVSLGAFLDGVDGDERARRAVRNRLEGTSSIDLLRVPLRLFAGRNAFRAEPAVCRRFAEGNASLPAAMARMLPDVRLGHRVHAISAGREGVEVEVLGPGGPSVVPGAAAVVAVPSRLVGEIRFEPALPADLALALSELPVGTASKLATPIEAGASRRSVQSADEPFWCWVADGRGGRTRDVLTSFAGGERVQRTLATASGDPSTWLARLAELNPDLELGGGARMKVWAADELARGSYSAFDQRSLDRTELFGRRVGPIAFAGEHTAGPSHVGTMEGAVRSGERAARQVLESLG
jgi:monoamine oxidase